MQTPVWLDSILCVGLFVPEEHRGFYKSQQCDTHFLLTLPHQARIVILWLGLKLENKQTQNTTYTLGINKQKHDEVGNGQPHPFSISSCSEPQTNIFSSSVGHSSTVSHTHEKPTSWPPDDVICSVCSFVFQRWIVLIQRHSVLVCGASHSEGSTVTVWHDLMSA